MAAQKSPLQGPSMPQDEDGTTTTTAMGTTHEEIDWESWCTFLEDVNFDHGSLALSSNLDSAPQNERIMGFS